MTPRDLRINKTLLAVAGAIVLVTFIGTVTYLVLCQVNPPSQQNSIPESLSATTGEGARKQAEQYLQAGDLTHAKSAYQTAYNNYTSEGNPAAAADAKIQIEIIDAKISKQNATTTQPPAPATK